MTTPCNRPGCNGTVGETGFCDRCRRRPLTGAAASTVERTTVPVDAVGPVRTLDTSAWLSGDLLSLPVLTPPDPAGLVLVNPEVPERSRTCSSCEHPVARTYREQPPLLEGHCGRCGEKYSFSLKLEPGDLVDDRYEVVGALQRGGLGWVYLARARNLDGTYVVLKGLVNTRDRRARELVANERIALTRLDHPNVVRIYDFVRHPDPLSGEPVDYLVMEYVGGLSLSQLKNDPAVREQHGPLLVDHVIAYGLEILAALEHLHSRGLLYCDMKPANAIRAANRLKIIDLGAVRSIDDRDSPVVGTPGYQVPQEEIEQRGATVRSDLHTAGRTLEALFQVTEDAQQERRGPVEISFGLDSFRRVVERATGPHEQRFATAAEMAEQLTGVLREVRALRGVQLRPVPSRLFEDSATLLDAGLSAAPPLRRWSTARSLADLAEVLPHGRPDPGQVASWLPAPLVRTDDPEAGYLAAISGQDARALLEALDRSGRESAEIHLRACRACLALGELGDARKRLARAVGSLEDAEHDWRAAYVQGLLGLAEDDVTAAEEAFTQVRRALPGELVPKLALGFCAEHAGRIDEARATYDAIDRQDRSQGSAAFGLVRRHLAEGDRDAAVALLDAVPAESRHAREARTAAFRVRSGRLPGEAGLPSAADLSEAVQRLHDLWLDGGEPDGETRARLLALLREVALVRVRRFGGSGMRGGEELGDEPTERALRFLLEESLRRLSGQAVDAGEHAALVDLANAVRPRTWW